MILIRSEAAKKRTLRFGILETVRTERDSSSSSSSPNRQQGWVNAIHALSPDGEGGLEGGHDGPGRARVRARQFLQISFWRNPLVYQGRTEECVSGVCPVFMPNPAPWFSLLLSTQVSPERSSAIMSRVPYSCVRTPYNITQSANGFFFLFFFCLFSQVFFHYSFLPPCTVHNYGITWANELVTCEAGPTSWLAIAPRSSCIRCFVEQYPVILYQNEAGYYHFSLCSYLCLSAALLLRLGSSKRSLAPIYKHLTPVPMWELQLP